MVKSRRLKLFVFHSQKKEKNQTNSQRQRCQEFRTNCSNFAGINFRSRKGSVERNPFFLIRFPLFPFLLTLRDRLISSWDYHA